MFQESGLWYITPLFDCREDRVFFIYSSPTGKVWSTLPSIRNPIFALSPFQLPSPIFPFGSTLDISFSFLSYSEPLTP